MTEDPGGSNERVTSWTYNGLSRAKTLMAQNATTGNQVTTYLYEDTVSAGRVTNTIYPDSNDTVSSGSDQVKFAYHTDGSLDTRKDQRQVIITYRYNSRRQTTYQDVTDFASSNVGAAMRTES